MNPFHPAVGKNIGYIKGIQRLPCTPETDYIKQGFPPSVDKKSFFVYYNNGFEAGKKYREIITQKLETNLGKLNERNNYVLCDFIAFCIHRFGTSIVFGTWEKRMNLELSLENIPQKILKQDVIHKLKEGQIQQAIQSTKYYFFANNMQDEYFSSLLKDLTFKVSREHKKIQEISVEEYQLTKRGIRVDLEHLMENH